MKKVIIVILVLSMVALSAVLTQQSEYEKKKDNYAKQIKELSVQAQEIKIKEVREQQRLMLKGMRQAFINFMNKYPLDLFERDKFGNIHYGNIKGDSVYYNEKTMFIGNDYGGFYNIHEKKNSNLIAGHVRPYWNINNIKFITSIVATPYKAFGNTGDVIIFDSFTGEVIVDNSENCKQVPEVLGKDGRPYITLYYKHPHNKNSNAFLSTVNNNFMWRRDSTPTDNTVLFFTEGKLNYETASNFKDFTLGEYDREFDEKIVLPFETLGIGNTDMQITIVLGSQEKEIVFPYKDFINNYKNITTSINYDAECFIFLTIIVVVIVMVCIFFMLMYIAIIENEKRGEKLMRRSSDNGRHGSNNGEHQDISFD